MGGLFSCNLLLLYGLKIFSPICILGNRNHGPKISYLVKQIASQKGGRDDGFYSGGRGGGGLRGFHVQYSEAKEIYNTSAVIKFLDAAFFMKNLMQI